MLPREIHEQRELELLATYAAKSAESRGREHDEPECRFRPAFQRDRDRIIHSGAFRRLEYKTQVFVNHEGDYYRTRLTHTLEVAQIARGLCRTLKLNEDLAEAIALAHDLGHTPFGHRGEDVMHRLMRDHGGFEHNSQSYRIVTLLEERYPTFKGLNLSYEVREGIAKHSGECENPRLPQFPDKGYPTLEAQIVDACDQIAYLNHDLDDGLESAMLRLEQLEAIPLWKEVFDGVSRDFPQTRRKIQKYQAISRLIHRLVSDLQEETLRRIQKLDIHTVADVHERGKELASLSDEMKQKTAELKQFLYTNLYRHHRVERMAQKSEKILTDLFLCYSTNPKVLPARLAESIQSEGNAPRFICDYIAGMTDRFALDEHAKLFDPQVKV